MEGDGTLMLDERKKNLKEGEWYCETPEDQILTVVQLDAVADWFSFLFDLQYPVVAYLLWYAQKISLDPTMMCWGKDQWKAFNWHLHVALCKVWNGCNNGIDK